MKFSIVIPCFNELKNIKFLINDIKKNFRLRPFEFIFVNNGSKKIGKNVSDLSDMNKPTTSINNKYLCIILLSLYLNKINKNKKNKNTLTIIFSFKIFEQFILYTIF